MLAVDTINPVKIVLHVFPFVHPWHVASVCVLLFVYVFIKEMKDLLYFSVKVFFHSILSIFFRDVEIVGVQNIPTFGPCIFSVNHANQFVDAVMLVCTCQRQASYLMAEVSYKRRVVGDLAWLLGVVPVKRPQDSSIPGTWQLSVALRAQDENETEKYAGEGDDAVEIKSYLVKGVNTVFTTELAVGDKVRPSGTPTALKIAKILNDTTLIIDGLGVPETFDTFDEPNPFDILKRELGSLHKQATPTNDEELCKMIQSLLSSTGAKRVEIPNGDDDGTSSISSSSSEGSQSDSSSSDSGWKA